MEGINKSTSSSSSATLLLCLALMMATMIICATSSTQEQHSNEITCMEAIQAMGPCTDFLAGYGPDIPPITCCFAATMLSQTATSPEERKTVCECYKNLHLSTQGLFRVSRIRQICAIGLPISSDPKQDCSSIH